LVDDDSIADGVGNKLGGTGLGNGKNGRAPCSEREELAATVRSMNREAIAANPTNATRVDFTVTFSESVTGVGLSDFSVSNAGTTVSGSSVTSVTSVSGSVYTVSVNTGNGSGTLLLDLVDDDSIADGVGNKLGGTGLGNG